MRRSYRSFGVSKDSTIRVAVGPGGLQDGESGVWCGWSGGLVASGVGPEIFSAGDVLFSSPFFSFLFSSLVWGWRSFKQFLGLS